MRWKLPCKSDWSVLLWPSTRAARVRKGLSSLLYIAMISAAVLSSTDICSPSMSICILLLLSTASPMKGSSAVLDAVAHWHLGALADTPLFCNSWKFLISRVMQKPTCLIMPSILSQKSYQLFGQALTHGSHGTHSTAREARVCHVCQKFYPKWHAGCPAIWPRQRHVWSFASQCPARAFVCTDAKLLSPYHLRDMFKVLISTEKVFLMPWYW